MFENFTAALNKHSSRIKHNVDAMIAVDTTLPFDEPEHPSVYEDSRGITRITVFDHSTTWDLKDGKWEARSPF